MADDHDDSDRKLSAAKARHARLTLALRANLKRRKAQARGRTGEDRRSNDNGAADDD